jgi:hypothetical protein
MTGRGSEVSITARLITRLDIYQENNSIHSERLLSERRGSSCQQFSSGLVRFLLHDILHTFIAGPPDMSSE